MTAATIRVRLADVLSDLLAKFQNGTPAIYVGEPPPDWTVNAEQSNIQCNIEIVPVMQALQTFQHTALAQSFRVRVISHGIPKSQYEAVSRVIQVFPDATVQEIPRNVGLGILAQHLITINA